jgi:branched-chain amino acid transport system ATP-binding protein
MFEVKNIKSGYGEVIVLKGIEFEMQHEIFAVLGANGAGKTTLMRTIAKLLPLKNGSIFFESEDVTLLPAYKLAEKGLALVPQEANIFPELTVLENLSLGGIVGHRDKQEKIEEIIEVFPDIADRINQKAGSLSGGESQMVAVGRALMQEPKLILLDEPTAGLAPKYVDNFFKMIEKIHREKNVSVMLAEQNATKALEIAHRIMVLSLGKIFFINESKNTTIEMIKEGYRI